MKITAVRLPKLRLPNGVVLEEQFRCRPCKHLGYRVVLSVEITLAQVKSPDLDASCLVVRRRVCLDRGSGHDFQVDTLKSARTAYHKYNITFLLDLTYGRLLRAPGHLFHLKTPRHISGSKSSYLHNCRLPPQTRRFAWTVGSFLDDLAEIQPLSSSRKVRV